MNIAIVLAAGKSERLNDINVPKQLYLLNNVPLFMYSVLTFNNLEDIDQVYVVTNGGKLKKLLSFAGSNRDVADPWYTGNFDETYDDVLLGCQALLRSLSRP